MNIANDKPWEKSWFFYTQDGKIVFFFLLGLHLTGFIGLFFFPLPTWGIALSFLFFAFMGGLGTSLVYHRSLTHKGVEVHPVVEQILIFFAMFNGSGTPITWVANHRHHHQVSDTPNDISSPHHGGFWWAHLRWLWQIDQCSFERYCPDMYQKPKYKIWNRLQIPIFALSLFFGLFWGGTAWLWLGPIRVLFALHVQCTVNSLCHLGDPSFENKDKGSSMNIWWLTPFHMFQGENWHGNHHDDQANPRIGKGWQVDLTWTTICILNKLNLVRRLRREH